MSDINPKKRVVSKVVIRRRAFIQRARKPNQLKAIANNTLTPTSATLLLGGIALPSVAPQTTQDITPSIVTTKNRNFDTLIPARVIKIHLPVRPQRYHHNCGLVVWHNNLLLASRRGWHNSRVFLHTITAIDNDVCFVTHSYDLNLRDTIHAKLGVEDPRLFIHQDRVHIAVTGYTYDGQHKYTNQLLFSLDDKLRTYKSVDVNYSNREDWEKNWQFFSQAGELYCVYSIVPHVVLRFAPNGTDVYQTNTPEIKLDGIQHYRGGAPPVLVGDEYYHWYHSVTTINGIITYGMCLYTFDAKPPFAVKRFVPNIILSADAQIKGWRKNVIFPCGAILHDDAWLISYGQNDRECRLALFNADDIERILNAR